MTPLYGAANNQHWVTNQQRTIYHNSTKYCNNNNKSTSVMATSEQITEMLEMMKKQMNTVNTLQAENTRLREANATLIAEVTPATGSQIVNTPATGKETTESVQCDNTGSTCHRNRTRWPRMGTVRWLMDPTQNNEWNSCYWRWNNTKWIENSLLQRGRQIALWIHRSNQTEHLHQKQTSWLHKISCSEGYAQGCTPRWVLKNDPERRRKTYQVCGKIDCKSIFVEIWTSM